MVCLVSVFSRWKQNLVGKCMASGKAFDDDTVSPVVRQTLQHWAYKLTAEDFELGSARVATHGASYIPKSKLAHVMAARETAGGGGGTRGDGRGTGVTTAEWLVKG